MVRFVPVFIAVALLVYGLVDCVQTRASRTRYMPKSVWILIIVILPIVGPIAWLLFGKNRATGRNEPRRLAPDEDPDFLWKLDRDVKRQQARAEAERRAREQKNREKNPEQKSRGDRGTDPGTGKPSGSGEPSGPGKAAGPGGTPGPSSPASPTSPDSGPERPGSPDTGDGPPRDSDPRPDGRDGA